MRRILSILVAIVLGLGPAISAVPARAMASGWTGQVDEAKIPACCRRNGKHHCSMGALPAAAGEITLSAPSESCPCAPRVLLSTAPASAALAAVLRTAFNSALSLRNSQPRSAALRTRINRAQPQRGPPVLQSL